MEDYAAATREWAIAQAETLKNAKASAEQGAQEEFDRRLAEQDRRRQENKAIAKSQFEAERAKALGARPGQKTSNSARVMQ